MKFAVIGGDMRIARLYSLLVSDGHDVCSLPWIRESVPGTYTVPAARKRLHGADCVVLPCRLWASGAF